MKTRHELEEEIKAVEASLEVVRATVRNMGNYISPAQLRVHRKRIGIKKNIIKKLKKEIALLPQLDLFD